MEEVGASEVGSKVDELLASDIVASDGSAVDFHFRTLIKSREHPNN